MFTLTSSSTADIDLQKNLEVEGAMEVSTGACTVVAEVSGDVMVSCPRADGVFAMVGAATSVEDGSSLPLSRSLMIKIRSISVPMTR
ncbi:hypothetical protein HPP92_002926 [Vanilla planifolia]|uniref:Uncharacterized protein n=1 Tax=Vanilla planifolia TaxID=51239 RepID=A0A835VJE2_VANPL|nr:hypothetical protein HPP92_002926 [Vanilla planifolia]